MVRVDLHAVFVLILVVAAAAERAEGVAVRAVAGLAGDFAGSAVTTAALTARAADNALYERLDCWKGGSDDADG
jgi:hypothetical protein